MTTSGEHASEDARRAPRWSELCWIGILAAIGVVQIVRTQWFDVAVYAVLVAVVTMDATGMLPERSRARAISLRVVVFIAIVCGAALILLPRHAPVTIAVLVVIGVAAIVAAWPGPRIPDATPWPRGLRRLAWAWGGILIAGCLWELGEFVARLLAPHQASVALSDLADPILSTLWGKTVFVVVWLVMGIWVLRRGPRR